MSSLGTEFPKEQARVRELMAAYRALPNSVGVIGAAMTELALRRADEAVISGDVVRMLSSYQELKEFK